VVLILAYYFYFVVVLFVKIVLKGMDWIQVAQDNSQSSCDGDETLGFHERREIF
jgi:hypothetical protein